MSENPWLSSDVPRGAAYDARFAAIEATGAPMHGQADLVASLAPAPTPGCPVSVLDAGCGTGRVAIELARRGMEVCGIDLDDAMLAEARAKAPGLRWLQADLAAAELDVGRRFDVVVAAGNVMIFLAPGTLAAVVATAARHLVPGGALVAGFGLRPDGLTLAGYDEAASAAGLTLVDRWSTWDREPLLPGSDYAVSVHRR